jgi:hypothetical protein
MAEHPFALKYLSECAVLDLVRVKANETAEWAIVADRSGTNNPIVFLTGDNAAFAIDTVLHGKAADDFDAYPVLSYGIHYQIIPEHAGKCELHAKGLPTTSTSLIRTKGSLVLVERDLYLVVGRYRLSGLRYFQLSSGDLGDEPYGRSASFVQCSLNVPALAITCPIFRSG